jgi:hypothetical protein
MLPKPSRHQQNLIDRVNWQGTELGFVPLKNHVKVLEGALPTIRVGRKGKRAGHLTPVNHIPKVVSVKTFDAIDKRELPLGVPQPFEMKVQRSQSI